MTPDLDEPRAAFALEPIGQLQERTQQSGAIVVGEIDQAGLLDEAAQLNQLPGAGAAFDGPGTVVGARADGFSSRHGRRRPP